MLKKISPKNKSSVAVSNGPDKKVMDEYSAQESVIYDEIKALKDELRVIRLKKLKESLKPYVPGDRVVMRVSVRGKMVETEGVISLPSDDNSDTYSFALFYPIKKDGTVSTKYRLLYSTKDIVRKV